MIRTVKYVVGYLLAVVLVVTLGPAWWLQVSLSLEDLVPWLRYVARFMVEGFPVSLLLPVLALFLVGITHFLFLGVRRVVRASRTNPRVRRNALIVLVCAIVLFAGGMLVVRSVSNSNYPASGFINVRGEWVVQPKYRFVTEFSEGYASVTRKGEPDREGCRGGRWELIDRQGRTVIAPISDAPLRVSCGRAFVTLRRIRNDWRNRLYCIEVPSGRRITPADFEYVSARQ